MSPYLVDEGTLAVGLMSVVLTLGLLGVAALGWYVIHCDRQNRAAERDLLESDGHGHGAVVESHAAEPGAAGVTIPPAPGAAAVPPRRSKGH